ncbi:sensor histidine kinase [Eleftheria terrae]|uniref:sensor histidine kinase n=1 Tax=Eleftheria terrae TaxID=1597781 RepID=UPI00263A94EA|nr:ATP-binding protein [Eleftheria terrae]WKB55552.1 ATP-binding protein [Eleftheria terrae]
MEDKRRLQAPGARDVLAMEALARGASAIPLLSGSAELRTPAAWTTDSGTWWSATPLVDGRGPAATRLRIDLHRLYLAAGLLAVTHLTLIGVLVRERLRRLRAHQELQGLRAQVVHLARVSAMGELVASLAHELSQPLTAVLGNARTAARLLSREQVGVAELKEIMQDIVDDVKRAADLLGRIREMAMRRESERSAVDVNEVVQRVVKLLAGESLMRRMPIALSLAPGPLTVQADRVQLQQVLLNLVLNAFEAASGSPAAAGKVEIHTAVDEDGSVALRVRDNGPGLPPGAEQRVFEPFYTTKASGMGMGLSIVRSIIEGHGGRIRATGNPEGGAEFHITLPPHA